MRCITTNLFFVSFFEGRDAAKIYIFFFYILLVVTMFLTCSNKPIRKNMIQSVESKFQNFKMGRIKSKVRTMALCLCVYGHVRACVPRTQGKSQTDN